VLVLNLAQGRTPVGGLASLTIGSTVVPQGAGSGFIIDPSGIIVTNNHVVEGAQALRVVLPPPDNRSFDAQLVGRDPQTDLAVIKITAASLPTVPLGNSAALRPGDWVVAIGNALDLPGGPTVTQGVVSATGRDEQEPPSQSAPNTAGPTLYDLIQTDAAINPGNSGGPLVNLQGQVVGINTLGSSQAQGIGFAISIDGAKPIIDQLRHGGTVTRAYLGIGGR
jgi:serine protease Do